MKNGKSGCFSLSSIIFRLKFYFKINFYLMILFDDLMILGLACIRFKIGNKVICAG
jgi:hypothetical protein